MKRAVFINGVPASGKSTVARAVADTYRWPLFALDTVKEPFFDALDHVDRALNSRLGTAAYRAIFDTIRAFPRPHTVIVEAWFGFRPLELLQSHMASAGIGEAVELWCHAPASIVCERYAARVPLRPAGHPGLAYIPELEVLVANAKPLGVFPSHSIDTSKPLDSAAVAAFLAAHGFAAA